MLIRLYIVYYAWALFCMNGGWIEVPGRNTGLFNDICWACWGELLHCVISVGLPTLFLLKILIYAKVYSWFSSHF